MIEENANAKTVLPEDVVVMPMDEIVGIANLADKLGENFFGDENLIVPLSIKIMDCEGFVIGNIVLKENNQLVVVFERNYIEGLMESSNKYGV